MTGRVERNMFGYTSQLHQYRQRLVDIRIVAQTEEIVQISTVLLQNSQSLPVKQQIQGQVHFRIRFDRSIDQSVFFCYALDVVGSQICKIGITQSGVTAEKKSI